MHTLPDWNTTDLFDGFLFLGAGHDLNGRSLPFHKGETTALWKEKNSFFKKYNIRYVLNMASTDKELRDMSYSVQQGSIKYKGLPMNDVDEFTNQMATMFDQGASFIEECCVNHLSMKARLKEQEQNELEEDRDPSKQQPNTVPLSIYVHCVAGVNRSAMVVVWWMVKYRAWNLREAWGTVCRIRDDSCKWRNNTLGGSPEDKKSNWFIGAFNTLLADKDVSN